MSDLSVNFIVPGHCDYKIHSTRFYELYKQSWGLLMLHARITLVAVFALTLISLNLYFKIMFKNKHIICRIDSQKLCYCRPTDTAIGKSKITFSPFDLLPCKLNLQI